MSAAENYFEEEEFTTQFNGRLVSRILRQGLAHWPYMVGFLVGITVGLFAGVLLHVPQQADRR